MASIVGDIAIQVGADIGPLVTQMDRAKRSVSGFGNEAKAAAGGGIGAMRIATLAMAGAALAAGAGIVTLTKRAIENAGAMNDASKATGVHVARLQAMSQVAEEASVSSESLISSLKKMENNIAGLQSGTKAQTDAFAALGLKMADLQGLSPDEQFAKIATSIEAIADPTQRTASAMDIFGKSGADLIPMMNGYAASLADVAQKQRDFGIALTDDQAAQLDAIGDSASRLSMAAAGLGTQLAITFGPATAAIIEGMQHALEGWTFAFQAATDALTTTAAEAKIAAIASASEEAAQQMELLAGSMNDIAFAKQAEDLRMLTASFQAGGMSVDEYRARVAIAKSVISEMIAEAGRINELDTSGAVSAMQAYIDKLSAALGLATALANVKVGATATSSAGGLSLIPDGASGPAGVSAGSTTPASIKIDVSGGGGGGGSGNTLEADLKAMQERFAAESDLVDQKYQDDLKKLEEFRNAKLLTEEQFNSMEVQATQDHQDHLAEIEQAAMAVKLSAISGAFGDVAALMNTHNKTAFEIGKKAALAGAIVDGYSAATSAWDKGMKIGGPPVAAAFTAASLIKTEALISGISSQSFSGGGSSASSSAGGSGVPSVPAQQSVANITLNGNTFSGDSMKALIDQLNGAFKQGYRLNLVNNT